ncbi:hypothetical protein [Halorubrum salipaludis]|uniref:hypothetical protein n=1 Tax=Halorubrum salipaludis TaxID=2032630 RepID=UPI001181B53F|nr:hypothetical protein [Halorubrum salipaludis]
MSIPDYAEHIDTDFWKPIWDGVVETLDMLDTQYQSINRSVIEIAVLHLHMTNNILYSKTGRGPVDMDSMYNEPYVFSGDCEDQSVQLASAYKHAGYRCLLVAILDANDSNGHLLVLVENPLNSQAEFERQLRQFYMSIHTPAVPTGKTKYFGEEWYIADPVNSMFIGDVTSSGMYIDGDPSGYFEFVNELQVEKV